MIDYLIIAINLIINIFEIATFVIFKILIRLGTRISLFYNILIIR